MSFEDIKAAVSELGDGRSFGDAQLARWANRTRKNVALDFRVSGFRGLYFLYKEATAVGGSVADQSRYDLPVDFIDDLNIFFDGVLVPKAPPGVLTLAKNDGDFPDPAEEDQDSRGRSEMWLEIVGHQFNLDPAPSESGKEIRLLYNGLPELVPESSSDDFTDYFMDKFEDLHIYGMAEKMAKSLGHKLANDYAQYFEQEKAKLQAHNRRHFFKNSRIRFQNWDEYREVRHILYPQYER